MSISNTLKDCQDKISSMEKKIDLKSSERRILEIDELMSSSSIWNNPNRASQLAKERQSIYTILSKLKSFKDNIEFINEYIGNFPEEIASFTEQIDTLHSNVCELEVSLVFNNETDTAPAIIAINAGAGGLEAANWVSMLLRMYLRFAEANGYKSEILDLKPSEEHSATCIDSVSIKIDGNYAYGFLKGETGVHRLIRNSPFSSSDARHTSFAAVYVSADIEDKIEVEVREEDLEVHATASGGSGGQSVNTCNSCIIMKHIPSGIQIRSQTERSQQENRRIALKLLKAKLFDLEMKKKNAEKDKLLNQQTDNAFGHQVRTYTLSPYKLVKDHKTSVENRNADDVLNGNIKKFLMANLSV